MGWKSTAFTGHLHPQISAHCTARSRHGGWSDLFSMSLCLPVPPKGPPPSVLAPAEVGRVACFYVVGNQQTNLQVTVLMPGEQSYRARQNPAGLAELPQERGK